MDRSESYIDRFDAYYNDLGPDQRANLKREVTLFLTNRREIILAYLFGSFVDGIAFKDIDLALFLDTKLTPSDQIEKYRDECSEELAKAFKQVFDVSIMNRAPARFILSILKEGELLFSRDEVLRTDLIENCSLASIQNEVISTQYLREIVF